MASACRISGIALLMVGSLALSVDLWMIVTSAPDWLTGSRLLAASALVGLFRLPILLGGIAFLRSRPYWLAFAGGVAALLPTNFTMLLTFPVGAGALFLLSRPTVRDRFRPTQPD